MEVDSGRARRRDQRLIFFLFASTTVGEQRQRSKRSIKLFVLKRSIVCLCVESWTLCLLLMFHRTEED